MARILLPASNFRTIIVALVWDNGHVFSREELTRKAAEIAEIVNFMGDREPAIEAAMIVQRNTFYPEGPTLEEIEDARADDKALLPEDVKTSSDHRREVCSFPPGTNHCWACGPEI
jgi:hypothetical protein